MADLVVVGSYNVGMTVYSAKLPAAGETVVGSRFERGPGGKGANQAIGARRLGTDVLFITRLGADAFGDEARSILLAEGLPEGGITTDDQNPTGIALVLVEDSGQNAISVARGGAFRKFRGNLLGDGKRFCVVVDLARRSSAQGRREKFGEVVFDCRECSGHTRLVSVN